MATLLRFVSHDGRVEDAVINADPEEIRHRLERQAMVAWGWGEHPSTWGCEWEVTAQGGYIRPERVISIEEGSVDDHAATLDR